MNKTMTGTVTAKDGRWFVVTCDDAPAHLTTLHLTPGQMKGATVGDRVVLGYIVTPSSGLWKVVTTLAKPKG